MKEGEVWKLAQSVMEPDQWTVYYLKYGKDMSVAEIAEGLMITRQAVDGRLARGKLKLLKALNEEAA